MAAVADLGAITEMHKKLMSGDMSVGPALRLSLAKLGNQLLLLPQGGKQLAQITLDTYEKSVLDALKKQDIATFERFVKTLKTLYKDFGLPPNAKILGLYLLHLLASDRIGEFHTELELLLSVSGVGTVGSDPLVVKTVELERVLMEGNYNKAHLCALELQKTDKEVYAPFVEKLIKTMRVRILEALHKSVESGEIPLKIAYKLLYIPREDKQELRQVLEACEAQLREDSAEESVAEDLSSDDVPMTPSQPAGSNFEIGATTLILKNVDPRKGNIQPLDVINNMIGYATEMERIV